MKSRDYTLMIFDFSSDSKKVKQIIAPQQNTRAAERQIDLTKKLFDS